MEAVGGGDSGRFLAAVLESVEAEISLTGGGGMAVDGDYAAFFAELVARYYSGQWAMVSGQLPGSVHDVGDTLEESPHHAVTSPWRVASRAVAQGLRKLARSAAIMGCL